MDLARIDRLNRSHREALRLYAQRYSTVEIAQAMGISQNTANGYLTEAARLLDAGGRPGAAALLVRYEAAHPESRGRFSVGDQHQFSTPPRAPTEPEEGKPANTWRSILPIRMGARNNDLSVYVRLAWIPFIAVACAIGFGSLAQGFYVIDVLVRGIYSATGGK